MKALALILLWSAAAPVVAADRYHEACLFRLFAKLPENRDAHIDHAKAVYSLRAEFRELKLFGEEVAAAHLEAIIEQTGGVENGPHQIAYAKKVAELKKRSEDAFKLVQDMERDSLNAFQKAWEALDEQAIPRIGNEDNSFYDAGRVHDAALKLKAAFANVVVAHTQLADLIRLRQQAAADLGKVDNEFITKFTSDAVDSSHLEQLKQLQKTKQAVLDDAAAVVARIKDRLRRDERGLERKVEDEPENKFAKEQLDKFKQQMARLDRMLGRDITGTAIERTIGFTTRRVQNQDPFGLPPIPR